MADEMGSPEQRSFTPETKPLQSLEEILSPSPEKIKQLVKQGTWNGDYQEVIAKRLPPEEIPTTEIEGKTRILRVEATVKAIFRDAPSGVQEVIEDRILRQLDQAEIKAGDENISLVPLVENLRPLVQRLTAEPAKPSEPVISDEEKEKLRQFDILDRAAREAGIEQGILGLLAEFRKTQTAFRAAQEAFAERVAKAEQRGQAKYQELMTHLDQLGIIPSWFCEKENLSIVEKFPPELFWRDSDFDPKGQKLRLAGKDYELLPVEQKGHARIVFDAGDSVIKVDQIPAQQVCWSEIVTFINCPWIRERLLPIESWGIVRSGKGEPHLFVKMPKITEFYEKVATTWTEWNEHPEVHVLNGIVKDVGKDNVGKYRGRWVLVDYHMIEPVVIEEGESYGKLLEQYDGAVKRGAEQYRKFSELGGYKNYDKYEKIKQKEVEPLQHKLREKIEQARKQKN